MKTIVELLLLAMIGHLVGDYLLQSFKMAKIKSQKGLTGAGWCTLHVLIYTASVCAFIESADPWVALSIFVPHWIIDRWSLGEFWLKLIKGRNMEKILMMENGVERDFAIAFYAPVYIAVDNTLHILCLLATTKLLMV